MKTVDSLPSLTASLHSLWSEALQRPLAAQVQRVLLEGDRTLYALWLCQVAHITRHTAAHQALVGTRHLEVDHRYARYCFEHALEEVGHEQMALRDLRALGFSADDCDQLPPPLAATERLNAYLYYLAERAHPASRRGFSFWAETCYQHLKDLTSNVRTQLGLSKGQMAFFHSHAVIDAKHAQDVERILVQVCRTEESWQAVANGMRRSFELAFEIFEEIVDEAAARTTVDSPYAAFLEAAS